MYGPTPRPLSQILALELELVKIILFGTLQFHSTGATHRCHRSTRLHTSTKIQKLTRKPFESLSLSKKKKSIIPQINQSSKRHPTRRRAPPIKKTRSPEQSSSKLSLSLSAPQSIIIAHARHTTRGRACLNKHSIFPFPSLSETSQQRERERGRKKPRT